MNILRLGQVLIVAAIGASCNQSEETAQAIDVEISSGDFVFHAEAVPLDSLSDSEQRAKRSGTLLGIRFLCDGAFSEEWSSEVEEMFFIARRQNGVGNEVARQEFLTMADAGIDARERTSRELIDQFCVEDNVGPLFARLQDSLS